MNALLTVTSCVEAATVSNNLLAKPIPNKETWRHHFKEERGIISESLSHDPSDIRRNYPGVMWHLYYQPQAKFPEEISCLLASSVKWGILVGSSCPITQSVAPQRPLPRIRLLLLTQPPVPQVAVKNDSMDVDELAGDDYVPPSQLLHASRAGKATKNGGTLQKWEGTLLLRAAAAKRHASSLWQKSTSEEEVDEDIPLPQYKFEVHD
ncbi:hypothetical protein EI94DRAFT_1705655 [Lactarius quietus]|nr:hypothetical protein EI94DRAFT_1705655 [Lactarius quietus]